jgi:phosphate-selective porin OprO and OprP
MKARLRLLAVMALVAAPAFFHAQGPDAGGTSASPTPAAQPSPSPSPNATLENTIEAGESSDEPPRRELVHWNEYKGPYFTMRVGGGILVDTTAYAQDTESKEQIKLSPELKLRDARLILRGTFPKWKRVTWSSGLMYDAPTHEFLVRETGLMIKVPELWGNLFIGRSKEGFSLNKVMVGYAGWTMERTPLNDASIPILADGIKWLGYSPRYGFAWNLGVYADWLSEGQTFSTYARQAVARPIWLPIHSEKTATLFHLGANLRYGKPKDSKLQLRSRPEAFPAPYFVDTGKFNASLSRMAGYEAYFRKGPWLVGSEYWWVDVTSPSTNNPVFHGGNVVATWIVTGETRAYNTIGGFFKPVSPRRPVFEGGPGAWELVVNYSTIDLDSGTLKGGKFWRFTPMVNWHMSDNVRLELNYGYGHLDRFNLRGYTHFFQTRVQLQL